MIPASRSEHFARWCGASIILFSALARVFTSQSRIPYWDIDPLTSWSPDTTRTPAMSLLFDALVWLAASAIIWAEGRAGRGIAWRTGLLALIGCVGVALHGWILTPLTAVGGSPPTHGDFQSMLLGSTWASAVVGAWALSMAARDPQVKRAAATTLLGVVIVLAAKGAMQVFIDHPRLVADFNANKDEMLASQGFQPGSVSARLFERRLIQSEATGWFGLSNVYGSFMAAGCAAFLALAVSATRAAKHKAITTGEAGLLWIATAIAATGLALSGSKGAIGAGALGCAVVALVQWMQPAPFSSRGAAQATSPRRKPGESEHGRSSSSPRKRAAGSTSDKPQSETINPVTQLQPAITDSYSIRTLLRFAPLIFPVLALLAICLRGVLGERIGELSLYFRWQYLLGTARIILAHPLLGTGPAGFKDQYLLFKEPTNPEEIDSPHCLPMDWLATMGIFGAAWVILWIVWLWKSGNALSEPEAPARILDEPLSQARVGSATTPNTPRLREGLVVALVVILASLAFSWWCEWAMMLPETLAFYTLAGLAWWFVARTGSRLADADPRALNIALFGASIVLGTHCMIEVTGVFTSSVGWVTAVVALAGSACIPVCRPSRRWPAKRVNELFQLLGFAVTFQSAQVFFGEYLLHSASLPFRQIQEMTNLQQQVSSTSGNERHRLRESLLDILARVSDKRVLPSITDDEIAAAIERTRLGESGLAAGQLTFTLEYFNNRLALTEIIARLHLVNSQMWAPFDKASDLLRSDVSTAIQILEDVARRHPRSSTAWARLASCWAAAAPALGPAAFGQSAVCLEEAALLDPLGLTPATRLARLYAEMGDSEKTARWARRALEVHANLYLDPLKGLTDTEKTEMEHLAAASPSSPSIPHPKP